ncbi:Scr1 family TA system antitoxin-like transcriptional regulator [Glycomyces arizonensis]|uniref:Scr1 family TA system antitoxin-like transcriptional regulator n=1 Tax=Glycomyces arizonensis TaxID=256035 RepID=UPI00047E9F6F|nr:Scr1 family TA system antitoxin-like transcriptional regulator [Glycomyces arizonensis]
MSTEAFLTNIQVARLLVQYRKRAKYTHKRAADELGMSTSKIRDLEHARARRVNWVDMLGFARIYGLNPEEQANLVRLAESSESPDFFHSFKIPSAFFTFLQMELTASKIMICESELITGLFQTEAYMDAITDDNAPDRKGPAGAAGFRLDRQTSFMERDWLPEVIYLTSEAALRRDMGGHEVMVEQVEHLKKLDRDFSLFNFLVVPNSTGAFHCAGSSFRIFEFEGGEFPKTVYLESFEGARYCEVAETVASFQNAFDESVKKAIPMKDFQLL